MAKNNDFSKGPVWKCILSQAVPLMIAQLVQLLYNVVDRIYIGHMEGTSGLALTGVGLTFPIITLIMAFTALFGMGGTPLFAMARGAGNEERAGKILGNSFALLLLSSVVLTVLGYVFCRPVLFAFGASEDSYVYAKEYLNIYLLGTVFSMTSTGLNNYINAQGFPKIGMLSIILGAAANIVLDPVFIFAFDMGVTGAALLSSSVRNLGAAFSLWKKCSHSAALCQYPHPLGNYQGYPAAWYCEFYHAGNQLPGAGDLQFHVAALRRRPVCWYHDRGQLGP